MAFRCLWSGLWHGIGGFISSLLKYATPSPVPYAPFLRQLAGPPRSGCRGCLLHRGTEHRFSAASPTNRPHAETTRPANQERPVAYRAMFSREESCKACALLASSA